MIEIIYENKDWLPFFEEALREINIPYRLNFINTFTFDPQIVPDNIIYLNRTSPSSHTRGHPDAVTRARGYLKYLASHQRRVINDIRTLEYEMSKVKQYELLSRCGISFPNTIASANISELIKRSGELRFPIMTKHNCSGKGLGIHLFENQSVLKDYLQSDQYVPSPDGILLLQEYIRPQHQRITRVEICNHALVYALHSSTHQGFELCPADACATKPSRSQAVCDVDQSLFTYLPDFQHPLVDAYLRVCREGGFDMAGIEFIEAEDGSVATYDINGTTNYSPAVEKASGHKAKKAFQEFIQQIKSTIIP